MKTGRKTLYPVLLAIVISAILFSCSQNRQGFKWNRSTSNFEIIEMEKPRRSMMGAFFDYFMGGGKRFPSKQPGPFSTDLDKLKESLKQDLSITWLGHSTVLIGIEGKVFLTDPVWSRRCSPVSFLGPKRFFDVPMKLKDLPKIDAILISHDHYDHLDKDTILYLAENTETLFYMPSGVGDHLRQWGIPEKRIREFKWWDEIKLDENHSLAMTPSRHFSGRTPFDRNRTLWASWVIMAKEKRIFFGGDSGMFPGFQAIGEKYGPFDLTMLEIGAFDQAWGDIHLGPENAIIAHEMLKGKVMMPIHWGTFNLALHDWDEPIESLITKASAEGTDLFIPYPGKAYVNPSTPLYSMWWRESGDYKADISKSIMQPETSN